MREPTPDEQERQLRERLEARRQDVCRRYDEAKAEAGKTLQAWMRDNGIQQNLLAKRASVSPTLVRRLEGGDYGPAPDSLIDVVRQLGGPAGELQKSTQVLRELMAELGHLRKALAGKTLRGYMGWAPSVHEQATSATAPPPRWPLSLPPRLPQLVGREDLLTSLHTAMAHGAAPRVVVLSGMGGVGKTSVAVEYAHRHLAELSMVWHVQAEDETLLQQGLAELAAQLSGRDLVDSRNPVASAHAALAGQGAQWLLIFDNAPDEISVRRFVPPAGRGWVIITSRSQLWPSQTVLDVPVLKPEVAARFLMSRTGDLDQRAALEMTDELGGLPLALEQAAAFMQGAGMSLADYLTLYRHRRADLLFRGEPAGHASVATTLSLAVSRLDAASSDAAGLLRLLAVMAPEPVPIDLLLADPGLRDRLPDAPSEALGPLLGDPLALADAIVELRRFSLISLAGHGRALAHRLVQHATKDLLAAAMLRQWEQAAAVLVEAAVPNRPELPDAWSTCAVLLPHARAALSLTSGGIFAVAQGLGEGGSYAVAVDLFGQITAALENEAGYGPHHPATLSARHSLARWVGGSGDAVSARDQLAALVPVCELILGPEHRDTLDSRSNLATWTGRAGDPAAARDQLADLLPVCKWALGPEHPDTLNTVGKFAEWAGLAGDPVSARDQFGDLVHLYEKILGPEHPSTLIARGNLATWTGRAGDPAAARDQLIALRPTQEQVLGPEHPETLTIRNNLAHWTGRAGDPAAARDQIAELALVWERVLGPEHPDTLTVRGNAGRWAGEAGDPAAARDLFTELLPIRERVSGPITRTP